MESLEGFDSIDELKQAISHLTKKYESLRLDERSAKIAEAKEIIDSYELTAEELGFSQATSIKKPAVEKKVVKRRTAADMEEQSPNGGQQGLW